MEAVEVFSTESKGRGLKAVKEFWAADVIFAERAYAAVVFDSLTHLVCHTCFKRHAKLHRCGQCKFAHYCDRTCQKDAWLNHKNECSAIKKHGKAPNENIRLAARIMWRIEKEGSGLTEGSLVSIDNLQNHVEHFGEEEEKELRIDLESFLEFWPPESKQFGMQYISHILGVINCNGFTLSDQRGLQAVGVGIFPNLCLVNHDCWPNCTVIFNNGKIELRALGKISVGEELTVSYIDFLNISEDRKLLLKKQYYFDCTCEYCQKGIKDDLMLAVKEGNAKPSKEAIKGIIQLSKDTMEKIEAARSNGLYHEVVKLCRECLVKQEPLLGDTNIYLLRILSILSEVLSYLQLFDEAAGYSKQTVDGYVYVTKLPTFLFCNTINIPGKFYANTLPRQAQRLGEGEERARERERAALIYTKESNRLYSGPLPVQELLLSHASGDFEICARRKSSFSLQPPHRLKPAYVSPSKLIRATAEDHACPQIPLFPNSLFVHRGTCWGVLECWELPICAHEQLHIAKRAHEMLLASHCKGCSTSPTSPDSML
uniref:[histone H3]-lysine(4) N-trimethyltransferase n=1 Tax=Varanus komodoensis TaxID=61221 RepID=A0A8D2J0F3_VARKO